MLSARGIPAVVGGEHHANLLGGLGGSFISLDIWVDADDAEAAAALLRDFRGAAEPDEPSEPDGVDDDDDDDGEIEQRINRRRDTGIALLLACFITLGTAHLFARMWLRGLALAALEIYGFTRVAHDPKLGGALVGGAILTDAIGAVWRIRTAGRSRLPRARVNRSPGSRI